MKIALSKSEFESLKDGNVDSCVKCGGPVLIRLLTEFNSSKELTLEDVVEKIPDPIDLEVPLCKNCVPSEVVMQGKRFMRVD